MPCAKLTEQGNFSIISDYIGRPIQAYDNNGNLVWQTDYDIYGNLRNLHGDRDFIPFRQLGQYEDCETGLYYNRFRYYNPETGLYISKDPISILGGLNVYAYVKDVNAWVDIFGLTGKIHKHHSDPKFLGGNPNQVLTEMIDVEHIQLHKDMNVFLDTKTKVVNGKTVSMRPKKGNSGRIIRSNFTRKESLEALTEFYEMNKSKYPQVYDDFFKQHPDLKPEIKNICKK